MDEVILHPPEPYVKTSISIVLSALGLLTSVVILGVFGWFSRGEKNKRPDGFGMWVTVHTVSERYKASWTPGKFWPKTQTEHSKKNEHGYKIYSAVWMFLIGWLGCSSLYLVLIGLIEQIEIFRETEHLISILLVSLSLLIAAFWPLVFRLGSHPETVENMRNTHTAQEKKKRKMVKTIYLWIACAMLTVSASLAVAASATLQAWTLPGPQYGPVVFLGPGYGLLAGWLLFAVALNCTVAISHDSYPSGTLVFPDERIAYSHRGSLSPPLLAILLLAISIAIKDPAIPVPAMIALFFFTPRVNTHLVASAICLLGIVISSIVVVVERMSS